MSPRCSSSPGRCGCPRDGRRRSVAAGIGGGRARRRRRRIGRRRQFRASRDDSFGGEAEGEATELAAVFALLPGPSSGSTTAAGTVAPWRPSESEREGAVEQVGRGREAGARVRGKAGHGTGGLLNAQGEGVVTAAMAHRAPTVATGKMAFCQKPPASFLLFCFHFKFENSTLLEFYLRHQHIFRNYENIYVASP